MPKYDLMVDGQRAARLKSDEEVRTWIARYRDEHTQDDPDATHVQVVEVRLMGGKMIPRERFF